MFTNMLAHADAEGWVDIHPRAIAEEVGLTVDEVKKAIDELESPDLESRSPEEGGRRIVRLDEHRAWGWRIVNHKKYRAIRSEEDRREQNRIAQEKFRNKNKAKKSEISNSKPSVSNSNPPSAQSAQAEAEAEAEVEAEAIKPLSAPSAQTEKKKTPLQHLIELGADEQAAKDWLTVRKTKRAPFTETVLNDFKREVAKAGITVAQAVDICARKSWQGFKASYDWQDALPVDGKPFNQEEWLRNM